MVVSGRVIATVPWSRSLFRSRLYNEIVWHRRLRRLQSSAPLQTVRSVIHCREHYATCMNSDQNWDAEERK